MLRQYGQMRGTRSDAHQNIKGWLTMRYGIPYKGSKNGIAKKIIDELPEGDVFVDLFGGGGAITHAAMLSGKWQRFIYNEISPLIVKAFRMAVNGEFANENRWISREEFHELKSTDPYAAICFSFGNNCIDYAYAKEIEPWKKALHYIRVYNDPSLMKDFGIDTDGSRLDIRAHFDEYKAKYVKWYGENIPQRLESLESLQSLGRLERLQSLNNFERLTILQGDYQAVEIPKGAVIYCDIPYKGTKCGHYEGFDHERFYKWAAKQDNIYISEYNMPPEFPEVCRFTKAVLSSNKGQNTVKDIEGLYTNKRTKRPKRVIYEQLSMFAAVM